MEAGPEALFCDFVAASNLQFVKSLKEFHDGLQSSITNVTTSEDEAVNACRAMWKVLLTKETKSNID